MDRTYTTTKIWKETLKKLRVVSILSGESQVATIDKLVNQEIERIENGKLSIQSLLLKGDNHE